jgi:hypothetical protein
MATRIIQKTWLVEGVLTNVTTAKMSDPTGTYGVKRNDTDAVVVVDGTNMTNSDTGVYEYSFEDVQDVSYTAYVEFVYDESTFHFEIDLPARAETGVMVASYSSLLEIVGKKMFGIRTGFSSDQTDDIEDCIKFGLRTVYSAHDWSFFRPVEDISTTAPYTTGTVTIVAGVVTLVTGTWPTWAATGILKVSNSYYSVASRDSNSQITLDDTSVAAAALSTYSLARPEVPLDDDFEAVANDSDLTYYPDQNDLYPPVRMRHDKAIRTAQQNNPYFDRPVLYSVRTVEFDPTVGSRKRLAFYPTPDAAYVLRVPMILRPTMVDVTNQYPVGGETLSQLITEACLAEAERLLDNREDIHTKRFWEMLPLAIKADQEKSSPTSLGPDCPRGEGYYSGVDDSYWARSARIGDLTLDGDTL